MNKIKEIKKLIAIVNCIKDSELLDNGEYYKVHSDFIISLEENKIQLLDYITNLQEENERLLKTQEMYEKKCNNIHNYILQNCEIIRHKDYDEVGKVNGGHILTLLAGGDEE